MKTSKIKLPAKSTQTLYYYKKRNGNVADFNQETSTATDTTTTCTSVITTTHIF